MPLPGEDDSETLEQRSLQCHFDVLRSETAGLARVRNSMMADINRLGSVMSFLRNDIDRSLQRFREQTMSAARNLNGEQPSNFCRPSQNSGPAPAHSATSATSVNGSAGSDSQANRQSYPSPQGQSNVRQNILSRNNVRISQSSDGRLYLQNRHQENATSANSTGTYAAGRAISTPNTTISTQQAVHNSGVTHARTPINQPNIRDFQPMGRSSTTGMAPSIVPPHVVRLRELRARQEQNRAVEEGRGLPWLWSGESPRPAAHTHQSVQGLGEPPAFSQGHVPQNLNGTQPRGDGSMGDIIRRIRTAPNNAAPLGLMNAIQREQLRRALKSSFLGYSQRDGNEASSPTDREIDSRLQALRDWPLEFNPDQNAHNLHSLIIYIWHMSTSELDRFLPSCRREIQDYYCSLIYCAHRASVVDRRTHISPLALRCFALQLAFLMKAPYVATSDVAAAVCTFHTERNMSHHDAVVTMPQQCEMRRRMTALVQLFISSAPIPPNNQEDFPCSAEEPTAFPMAVVLLRMILEQGPFEQIPRRMSGGPRMHEETTRTFVSAFGTGDDEEITPPGSPGLGTASWLRRRRCTAWAEMESESETESEDDCDETIENWDATRLPAR